MLFSDVFSRILLVFLLSSLYGIERQKNHKPAGFGTFTLVAVGACSLVIIASEFGETYSVAIIGAVVTGIGFLGAGALLRNNDRVFGFATAASIWFFAIFGLVIGLGYFAIGFLIYVIVWLAVMFDNYLEEKGLGSYRRRVTITYNDFDKKDELSDILADYSKKFNLISIQINKKEKTISSSYLIEGMKKEIGLLLKELHKKKWCTSVKFE
jgi:putative Mg2+ transporter-C (MgtC) family protein